MIGIYKITNLINGKIYIGQSNNIKRRFYEYKTKGEKSRIPLDIDIMELGEKNFSFEVLEECSIEQLNERETYYIQLYNSNVNGYNRNLGGSFNSLGENNGRAILTDDDIKFIRQAYQNHQRRKAVYQKFQDKISFNTFAGIWDGRTWGHIMPEVFTEENKRYYSREATNGGNSENAAFTDEEVVHLRERYVNETAKQIYEDVKDRCTYSSLQSILWGRTYGNLPIYKKKEKKWINR